MYLIIDKIDESIKDCDSAIELNKNFVKVNKNETSILSEYIVINLNFYMPFK